MNHLHRPKGQALANNRRNGRGILVSLSLGALMLMLMTLSFLPGCGSGSTPPEAVKGKNEKAAPSAKALKPSATLPLITDKQEIAPGAVKEVLPPGATREEMEARAALDRRKLESPKVEVLPPGITRAELKARDAAEQKPDPKVMMESLPGFSQRKLAAGQAQEQKPDPKVMMESLPGVSQRGSN